LFIKKVLFLPLVGVMFLEKGWSALHHPFESHRLRGESTFYPLTGDETATCLNSR
jgi:hypothetical protein